jgi:hypothetical protein
MTVKDKKKRPQKPRKKWGEWKDEKIPKKGVRQMTPLERKL